MVASAVSAVGRSVIRFFRRQAAPASVAVGTGWRAGWCSIRSSVRKVCLVSCFDFFAVLAVVAMGRAAFGAVVRHGSVIGSARHLVVPIGGCALMRVGAFSTLGTMRARCFFVIWNTAVMASTTAAFLRCVPVVFAGRPRHWECASARWRR